MKTAHTQYSFRSASELEEFLFENNMYIPFVEKVCGNYLTFDTRLHCSCVDCPKDGCTLYSGVIRKQIICASNNAPCPEFKEYLEEILERHPEYRI